MKDTNMIFSSRKKVKTKINLKKTAYFNHFSYFEDIQNHF
jgi:hypothetical protein